MPVDASELVIYGAASRPEDDASVVGGAIDVTARPFDLELSTPGNLQAVSSGADTRTLTVRYRGTDGIIATAAVTLTGTTPVVWNPAITAERLIEATLSATHASNTVQLQAVTGGVVLHTFAASETKAFRLFIKAVSTSGPKVYYEKLFFKNLDALLAFQSAVFRATADPGAKLAVALCTAFDDNGTAANRLTAPAAGIGAWTEENIDLSLPAPGNLAAGSAIGFWVRLTLAANEVPLKNFGSYQLRGQSA